MVTVVSGILSFLPMLMDSTSYMEHPYSPLEAAVYGDDNNLFNGASIASLTLAVPILLDCLLDMLLKVHAWTRDKFKQVAAKNLGDNKTDIMTDVEKLIFLVGVNIVPVVHFLPSGSVQHMALFVQCCLRCQLMLVGGVVMASLCRFDKRYFPVPWILLMYVSWFIFCIYGPFVLNDVHYAEDDAVITKGPAFKYCITGCGYFMGVSMSLQCLFWMVSSLTEHWFGVTLSGWIFRRVMPGPDSNTNGNDKKGNAGPRPIGFMYFRAVYCLTFILWIVLRSSIIGKGTTKLDDKSLFNLMVPFIIYELSVLFFGLRLVKHEAVEALIKLISAKRDYVRYISHELRTPLNAAHSGIQLLVNELSRSNTIEDAERLDVVQDVALSLTTTVDILNGE